MRTSGTLLFLCLVVGLLSESQAHAERNMKIGEKIRPYSWPFLVVVVKENGRDMDRICEGTIVDPYHVISAAHCFTSPTSYYYILAAEYDNTVYEHKEQVVVVEKFRLHPNYRDDPYSYDVAVVKLFRPLEMTKQVQAIELNTKDTCPQDWSICTEAGWGHTQFGGEISTVPLKVDVSVMSRSTCRSYYNEYGDDQLCAGGQGVDARKGDSGGPLICDCEGSKKLAGIVSYRHGYDFIPGVYARVSYFTQWIKDTIATL